MREKIKKVLDILAELDAEFSRPVANPFRVMELVAEAANTLDQIGITATAVTMMFEDCQDPLCEVHGGPLRN